MSRARRCYAYALKLSRRACDSAKGCFYVGETCRTPETRAKQHASGYRASRTAKRYRARLAKHLTRAFSSRAGARRGESQLSRSLRRAGFGVHHSL